MYVYINNKGVIPCVSRHCVVFCMVNVYIRENGRSYAYINNKGVIPCVSRHCVVFCMVNVYIRENGMFLHVYIVVGAQSLAL